MLPIAYTEYASQIPVLGLVLQAEYSYFNHGLDGSPSNLHVISMLMHATSYTVYAAQSDCIDVCMWKSVKC